MRTRMTIAWALMLCALPVAAALAQQPAQDLCAITPPGEITGVCPPTGNEMGQSNYMQSTSGRGTVLPVCAEICLRGMSLTIVSPQRAAPTPAPVRPPAMPSVGP
jgi:hypothetical protein